MDQASHSVHGRDQLSGPPHSPRLASSTECRRNRYRKPEVIGPARPHAGAIILRSSPELRLHKGVASPCRMTAVVRPGSWVCHRLIGGGERTAGPARGRGVGAAAWRDAGWDSICWRPGRCCRCRPSWVRCRRRRPRGSRTETLNLQLQPGSAGALVAVDAADRGRGRDGRRRRRSPAFTRCRAPPRTWASSPRSSSANPAVQYAAAGADGPGPDRAQRPGLHQRRRVAVERHLGHQCPRGLERHHRLGPGDRRRHRHRARTTTFPT